MKFLPSVLAGGLLVLPSLPFFGCADGGSGQHPPDENLFLSDWFLDIAHRGGGRLAPEETLGAFENALAVGADVLELDLHATSDGVIVCMHDAEVDRTTDGSGRIREMTFDELRALDAGFSFSQDGGQTFPARQTGIVVPTFEEVLEAFPEAHMIVELKQVDPPIVDPVLDLVERHQAADRIILASVTDSVVQEVREKAPDQMTGFATAEMITFVTMSDADEETYQPPCRFMQAPHDAANEDILPRVQRFDIKVHAWTVNDEAEMQRLIALGIAGIITDDPALLDSVLAEAGLR